MKPKKTSVYWDPKDKEDRERANISVLSLLKQGYRFNTDYPDCPSESYVRRHKGLSSKYLKLHDHVNMEDLLMTVVDGEDLTSILDYLAHIGLQPMLHVVIRQPKRGKHPNRAFKCKLIDNGFVLADSEHVNPLQAIIDAVFLWDKTGRSVLSE